MVPNREKRIREVYICRNDVLAQWNLQNKNKTGVVFNMRVDPG